jgi:hypothetical protein
MAATSFPFLRDRDRRKNEQAVALFVVDAA